MNTMLSMPRTISSEVRVRSATAESTLSKAGTAAGACSSMKGTPARYEEALYGGESHPGADSAYIRCDAGLSRA